MKRLEPTKIKLDHPMADQISIISGEGAYCGEGSSEIAFFFQREWVTNYVEPFTTYADGMEGDDTLVYGWVPNEIIDAFVDEYHAQHRCK